MSNPLKVFGFFVVFLFFLISFAHIKDNFDELNQKNEMLAEEIQKIAEENEKLIERERNLSEKIVNLFERVENLEGETGKLRISLEREKHLNRELEKSLERVRMQKGLANPTYTQLKKFVMRDDTEMFEWSKKFDCTEFSNRFIQNFAGRGFFSCTTEITFDDDTGHIVVAVNTTDRGLYYVEPQSDYIIEGSRLKVGANYCSLVDWKCNWEIKKISSCFELKI